MSEAHLETLKLSSLQPHPKNPRLLVREDVVEGIKAQVVASGEFSQMHAPIVRPVDSHYEIISGHHRVEAARRAAFESIPCWVSEMDDETAYMLLVLSNAQGELGPLEIGVHALHYVPPEKGGRGKKGGLSEYAKQIGRNFRTVSELRHAAEVYEAVKASAQAEALLDKAKHLSAIHAVDALALTSDLADDDGQPLDGKDAASRSKRQAITDALWRVCVKWMLERGWSAADTEHWIGNVRELRVPNRWRTIFLPLGDVIDRMLHTQEFSAATLKHLCSAADAVITLIESETSPEKSAEATAKAAALKAEFETWLHDNAGVAAWDVRKLVAYQRGLEARLAEERDRLKERWCLGDWREHVPKLPDESVSLVLTDPPYGMGFQSDRRVDRRQERRHDEIANDADEQDAAAEIEQALAALLPKMRHDAHVFCFCPGSIKRANVVLDALTRAGLTSRGLVIWDKEEGGMGDPKTTVSPQHEFVIHAVKGSPMLYERIRSVVRCPRVDSDRHPTEKPTDLLKVFIDATTAKGEIVADPFGGVGSTLVAARAGDREFWGCELSPEYHDAGVKRLS